MTKKEILGIILTVVLLGGVMWWAENGIRHLPKSEQIKFDTIGQSGISLQSRDTVPGKRYHLPAALLNHFEISKLKYEPIFSWKDNDSTEWVQMGNDTICYLLQGHSEWKVVNNNRMAEATEVMKKWAADNREFFLKQQKDSL
jgi:hypothetical protein